MADPYDQFEAEGDTDAPKIIGQVSGPTSWSEYERSTETDADGDDPFCRRNGTALPMGTPMARGR